jgi:type IV secretion system protein VirD4
MRTHFPDPSHYASSDTCTILQGLDDLAQQLGIPALKQASDAIHGMLNNQKTLTSILDTARSNLNPLTRSPTASAAMKRSDWTPLDLRRRPGTTVYFCLKPDDMKAYAPLVRLVFQQHVSQLTRNFTPKKGELPITFFLDEMPQLGYMPNMSDLVDVGRGAAVCMWMFMQYMSQIRDTYQIKGPGLIEACRVRSYISPDTEAAKAIAPLLGETRNLFSGEKKPLVYPHELAGREFVDDIVVVATGEHPARLSKLNYYADAKLNPLTELAPPHVPRQLPAPPQANGQQPAAVQPAVAAKANQPAIALKPAPALQHVQRNRDPVLRPRNT